MNVKARFARPCGLGCRPHFGAEPIALKAFEVAALADAAIEFRCGCLARRSGSNVSAGANGRTVSLPIRAADN